MRPNILIIDGHPDPAAQRLVHALADAYRQGAEEARHDVIFYPLWLGSMPAMLKALLEQMLRPGFAFSTTALGKWPVKYLSGKSARIVVTMGMPAFIYRWYFRAHSLRSLQRNILEFVGFRGVRATIVGRAGSLNRAQCQEWLATLRRLGRAAA
jgi:putative NADPH-quinone reductase